VRNQKILISQRGTDEGKGWLCKVGQKFDTLGVSDVDSGTAHLQKMGSLNELKDNKGFVR